MKTDYFYHDARLQLGKYDERFVSQTATRDYTFPEHYSIEDVLDDLRDWGYVDVSNRKYILEDYLNSL
jgi:hypothetical protein